jgi:hypothetical protein
MAGNTTIEFGEVIQALLNEDELFSLRERRSRHRKTFVRPVHVVFGDKPDEALSGFTRDLSDSGIGLIHRFEVKPGDQALVSVNRLWDGPVTFRCKACWSGPGAAGWFQSGWLILAVESAPNERR